MTLTKADMALHLCNELGFDRNTAKLMVECFFDEIKSSLKRDEEVKLSRFGNFKVRKKNARPGRNPKTGKEAVISARKVVTFHVGEKLKAQIEKLTPATQAEIVHTETAAEEA